MNEHRNDTKSSQELIAVGIDWADREHVVCLIDQHGRTHGRTHASTLEQSPQAIDEWAADLQKTFPEKTSPSPSNRAKGR